MTATVTVSDIDYRSLWDGALSFDQFVDQAQQQQDLWRGVHRLARIPEWARAEAHQLAPIRLLVIAEDWCGDAANTVPVLAKLAEEAVGVELRIVRRDEHSTLMDRYLSPTGARAIPVVIALDSDFRPKGWWGSRPSQLQEWVMANRDMEKTARYLEIRKWYARDRGETTLREVLSITR